MDGWMGWRHSSRLGLCYNRREADVTLSASGSAPSSKCYYWTVLSRAVSERAVITAL